MKIFRGVDDVKEKISNSVVTIGNFDGVHKGHQMLIKVAKNLALSGGVPCVVMTFDPHPLKVLAPQRGIKKLFTLADQQQQLEALGVDVMVIEPFNKLLASLEPEEFLRQKIQQPFSPKTIVVGYDFAFGRNRQGTAEFLLSKSKDFGFKLKIVSALKIDGQVVSSSAIRQFIETGKVDLAHKFLGRPFYLRGPVVQGAHRGKSIGFPTANIQFEGEIYPARGVYVSFSHVNKKRYLSVTNVGHNPTFFDQPSQDPKIETHILDFAEDLYGQTLQVDFFKFLRAEKKFVNAEELKGQIRKDIQWAREWNQNHGN